MIKTIFFNKALTENLYNAYPLLTKTDNNHLISHGKTIAQLLSKHTQKEDSEIAKFWSPAVSAILIQGLPLDKSLPFTPYNGELNLNQVQKSISSIMGILNLMEIHPVVYFGENKGDLIRNVVPSKANTNEISSHGSKETFGPHVDNPD